MIRITIHVHVAYCTYRVIGIIKKEPKEEDIRVKGRRVVKTYESHNLMSQTMYTCYTISTLTCMRALVHSLTITGRVEEEGEASESNGIKEREKSQIDNNKLI